MVMKAEQERRAAIVRAEGESEAARLVRRVGEMEAGAVDGSHAVV